MFLPLERETTLSFLISSVFVQFIIQLSGLILDMTPRRLDTITEVLNDVRVAELSGVDPIKVTDLTSEE